MLGAIIGDVAGSIYEVEEVRNIKTGIPYEKRIQILDRRIPLFSSKCSYTDDTVLTVALADALLHDGIYEEYLRKYGKQEVSLGLDIYGRNRFGKGFIEWLKGNSLGESYGNGCAMRISAIANYFGSLEEVLEETKKATIPSHNHLESITASSAVATAIYMAKERKTKSQIKKVIEETCGYNLDYSLEDLQRNYRFTSKASDSVPQAIYCFLESNGFEDAIRKAISIGGDADTIAAITGSIAEAYYGIPDELIRKVWHYLPEYVRKIVNCFYFELEFIYYLKKEKMCNKEFLKYIQARTLKLPSSTQKEWFGCFPITTKDNILKEVRLMVPELENMDSLLVNIHEYTHAFELYNLLGTYYNEERENREERAKQKEKEYIKKRRVNTWNGW